VDNILVMKFGGTSVGSVAAMNGVLDIIKNAQNDWKKLVVVTSALAGVTNTLIESALAACQGDTTVYMQNSIRLKNMHNEIAEKLIPDLARQVQLKQEISHLITEFMNLCEAISILGEATPRALDAVSALGERMSARLLAGALISNQLMAQVVEATQLIITDNQFQSAHPDFHETELRTKKILLPLINQGIIPIVTGFIGATKEGITTTLGRGGSDYSAAIIAAALNAKELWIWTDVDGVMTADPRVVPEAKTIPYLSFREVAELAYFGAKVLHPKTIRPVIEAGIGLRVCNTFNPAGPGTWLVDVLQEANGKKPNEIIKAVTLIRGINLITLEGRGMLGVPGVAARTFKAVAETGTSVPLISQASSEQSICFAVPAESTTKVIQAIEKAFANELRRRDIDRVWATDEVDIITVVGEGLRNTPGVAGIIFNALGEAQVNVIAIAQGSSEVSISMIVDASEGEKAVRALHKLINKEG